MKTPWHTMFSFVLQELLTPLNIDVHSDFQIMAKPPEADVILIRRKGNAWTDEQKNHLPDGIRDNQASRNILEFKYTESFSTSAMIQTLCYDWLYKQTQKESLMCDDIATYMILSKTPVKSSLNRFGYTPTDKPGVYKTKYEGWSLVTLIVLNELSDEPHNAFVKCFASRQPEKQKAFSAIKAIGSSKYSNDLIFAMQGLFNILFKQSKEEMPMEMMSPEKVMELGRQCSDLFLSNLSIDERLNLVKDIPVNERFKDIPVNERLEVLNDISPELIEAYLKSKRSYFKTA